MAAVIKKLLWILPTLLLLWVVGYGVHLHRMLARVSSLPGVTLTVEPYQLQPYAGPTREINLGYATFKLPAKWEGQLVRMEGLGAMLKQPGDKNLGFLPPASFRDDTEELAKSYRELFGEEMPSFHELRKKSMAARPISVLDVLHLGRTKTMRQVLLLSLKSSRMGSGHVVCNLRRSSEQVTPTNSPHIRQ